MSANFQLGGNMPDVKDTLKTSLNEEARSPVHFFQIMGCILFEPGDLRGFNSLKILLTSLGEQCRRLRSLSLITWSNDGKFSSFSAVKAEENH